MVGRNDLCPCGSGKKYKKCCAIKNEITQDEIVENEIGNIIFHFFENAIQNPKDLAELGRYEREWLNKLGGWMDREEIGHAVSEYFLFVARRDLWNRYLLKTLNDPSIRPATRAVLETWQNPIILLGKVTSISDQHFVVEELLGHSTYQIDLEEGMDVVEEMLLFGLVLPDQRVVENGIHLINGLSFIRNLNGMFEKEVQSLAKESGVTTGYDFFKAHMVDLYVMFNERESEGLKSLLQNDLTPQQSSVIQILADKLNDQGAFSQLVELLQMVAIAYLYKEEPSFRKPEVIAGAVFAAADDNCLFEHKIYSRKDVAELFGISVGSMMKHIKALYDIFDELIEAVVEDEQTDAPSAYSYFVGTDPRVTERVNWELYCKTDDLELETEGQLNRLLQEKMKERFIPKGKKQKAQSYAYDAYDSENEGARFRLTAAAYATDSENVDANLLKAEFAETEEEVEGFYQKAVNFGEVEFDDESDNAWALVTNRPYMRAVFAYGIWLYENGRYAEAVKFFYKLLLLNTTDSQGARHWAISAYIYAGDYAMASRIIEDYCEKVGETGAVYAYLRWLLEEEVNGQSELSEEYLIKAEMKNPFVGVLLEEGGPDFEFPRRLDVEPGSAEEALYIYCLL